MDEVDEYISDNRGWIGTNGYMHKDLNGNVVATIRVGTDWEQKDDGTTEYFYSASPEIALGQRQTANERSQFNALRQEAAKQHFKSVDEAARWIEERARQINR